ncbi:MAG: poly-gamma-glutamate biosynthesis protein PgsC [Gemmatimonadota bacterium]|nr:MAG: poly-gamma-glutamate biosynthesis protein PgsC [Gemmatimonadota bacterium]
MIAEAIGIGLVISLVFSEILGLAAGGMVVPGYIALYLDQPLRILGTLLAALGAFLVVRFLSNFMIIYGRRRLVMVILFGFLLGYVSRQLPFLRMNEEAYALQAIGYIIPGLIANWMERQGVLETITTMFMAGFLVRLLVILIHGGGLIEVALW